MTIRVILVVVVAYVCVLSSVLGQVESEVKEYQKLDPAPRTPSR